MHTHTRTFSRFYGLINKSVVSFAQKEFIDEFWIKRKSFFVKWNTNQMSIIDEEAGDEVCLCVFNVTQRETPQLRRKEQLRRYVFLSSSF